MKADANQRKQIIESLELLASRDEQLAYQDTVPIADVSAELFCAWDDVFSPRYDLSGIFSADEQTALLAFHDVFQRVCRLLPHSPLPPIREFVHSPHWLQLSRAATRTLHALQSASSNDNSRNA